VRTDPIKVNKGACKGAWYRGFDFFTLDNAKPQSDTWRPWLHTTMQQCGTWHPCDPDHQISSRGGNYVADAVLTSGEDHVHVAAGLGLAFERFQLDLAADFSELVDTLSFSLIYSF